MTTWKDCAGEFRAMDQGEGWAFARLVACSVRPPVNGRPSKSAIAEFPGKVSAEEFGGEAGTSGDRVTRFYTAWEGAAAQGLCVPAADLTPADATTTPVPDLTWGAAYRSNVGKNVADDRKDAIRAQATADGTGPSKAIDIASNPKALAAAIKADPATADAAARALAESSHPVLGRSPSTPEGDRFRDDVKRTNSASDNIAGRAGEAVVLLKKAAVAYDKQGSDLADSDRTALLASLKEAVVQAETMRMSVLSDAATQVTS